MQHLPALATGEFYGKSQTSSSWIDVTGCCHWHTGMDVWVIWLQHLSSHWSPALIQWSGWLGWCSSLLPWSMCIQKLCIWPKRMTICWRWWPLLGQGYMTSWAPLQELTKEFLRSAAAKTQDKQGQAGVRRENVTPSSRAISSSSLEDCLGIHWMERTLPAR